VVGTPGDRSRVRVKDAVGRFGEQVAVDRLVAAGLEIVDRNWRCPAGEIDIVAVDAGVLVFVEVKTRSSLAFGDPAEAVSRGKAARLRRLALHWLADHPDRHGVALRFDVVSVLRRGPDGPIVRHIEGAF
jgi:putative endonuclease